MPKVVLPQMVGPLEVRPLSWDDFPGTVDESMTWSAHIFWSLEYSVVAADKRAHVTIRVSPKSWVKEERKGQHLLNHEQGHYLIGTLCALEFLRRLDAKQLLSGQQFEEIAMATFDRTLKEHLELEQRYDYETDHRRNFAAQEKWDKYLLEKLAFYRKVYDRKKKRFVRLSEKKK